MQTVGRVVCAGSGEGGMNGNRRQTGCVVVRGTCMQWELLLASCQCLDQCVSVLYWPLVRLCLSGVLGRCVFTW